jgi:uncharacterized membrane protein
MKFIAMSGAVLAAAAFSFAVSGVGIATTALAEDGKIMCSGVNSCKGHSECKTANSSCKGHNACKGHGWLSLSKADCDAHGGKVIEG